MKTEGIVLTTTAAEEAAAHGHRHCRSSSSNEDPSSTGSERKHAAVSPDSAAAAAAAIPVFMTKDPPLRPILPRPVDAALSRRHPEPDAMCITASPPPWARVRHWSAPERVKDSAETVLLASEPATAPWESPLSQPEDVKVISGLLERGCVPVRKSSLTSLDCAPTLRRGLHPMLRRYATDKPLTWAKLLAKRKMAQLAQIGLGDHAEQAANGDRDLEQELHHVPELPNGVLLRFAMSGGEEERPVDHHRLRGGVQVSPSPPLEGEESSSKFKHLATSPSSASHAHPAGSSAAGSLPETEERSRKGGTLLTAPTQTEKTHQSEIQSSYRSRSNQPHKKQLEVTSTPSLPDGSGEPWIPLRTADEVTVKRKRKKRPQMRPASKAGPFATGLFGNGLGVAKIVKWLCVSLFLVACLGPMSAYGNSKSL